MGDINESLLIYLIEELKRKKNENIFSYKDLCYTFTHLFRIDKYHMGELIKDMCRVGLLIYNKDYDEKRCCYNINYDAEKELIFKLNEKKLKELKKMFSLQEE